jgi:pyrimidine deaminase RibD-like protein
MEAWNWLEREGMLIRDPQLPADWFSISRPGEELLKQNAYESGDPSGLGSAAVDSTPRAPNSETDDNKFERLAIEEARKSVPEDERIHPKVGVVVVKNGRILATAHRGEISQCHAEYIALERKLPEAPLSGAMVYTTLEPCTTRKHPKVPCADRLAEEESHPCRDWHARPRRQDKRARVAHAKEGRH